jgi:hypothetical protein
MTPAIAAIANNFFRMLDSLAMDASRLAPARKFSQFIARDIVPGKTQQRTLQFSAFFAGAGTH